MKKSLIFCRFVESDIHCLLNNIYTMLKEGDEGGGPSVCFIMMLMRWTMPLMGDLGYLYTISEI